MGIGSVCGASALKDFGAPDALDKVACIKRCYNAVNKHAAISVATPTSKNRVS